MTDFTSENLRVNGVDVVPLVEAELNRRYPDRVKMRPTDADGFREAWDILERLWEQTVQRARGMAPELLHEMPDEPSVPRDRDARPSLEEVLALRLDRMATVRQVIADLTDEQRDGMTEPVMEPGYPESESFADRRHGLNEANPALTRRRDQELTRRRLADRPMSRARRGSPCPSCGGCLRCAC